jgi:hypothetical protein
MKSLIIFAFAGVAASFVAGCGAGSSAPAGSEDNFTSDACTSKAISAAEDHYGNDPVRTKVRVLAKGQKYRVTVGIGNDEDGPQDYYVTFAHGCSSKPHVTEVPWLTPSLQSAVHQVYQPVLKLGASRNLATLGPEVGTSALTGDAKRTLILYSNPQKADCSEAHAYGITVQGTNTFAVTCTVTDDSIKMDIYVFDASGNEIDDASLFDEGDVGTDGVAWRNYVYLKQD